MNECLFLVNLMRKYLPKQIFTNKIIMIFVQSYEIVYILDRARKRIFEVIILK